MRDCQKLLAVFCLLFSCGCFESEHVDLEVIVRVDGDVVTISWKDPRAVHDLAVYPRTGPSGSAVWSVTAGDDIFLRPNTPAVIRPPLEYGQDVEGATILGPQPLVTGIRYEVKVDEKGWGEGCSEIVPEVTETTQCSLADGSTMFTF
jgi:hypothetical protein